MTGPATKKKKASNLKKAKDDSTCAAGSGEKPCPLNNVTPHIEPEYKTVLLDRKLSAHQTGEPASKHIHPDPTYILVWATQTNKGVKPWKKNGKLTVSPANVEVFLDEKCKKKLTKDLTYKQLTGGTKKKLWLRGVTAGKFTAKLTLEDPAEAKIKLKDNPAEQEMGVVEIIVEVHHHDQAKLATKKVPGGPDVDPVSKYHDELKKLKLDQEAMSDEDKVKKGRLLHEQKDAHFGRSKLVVKKLVAGQWPGETDSYEVVLDQKNVSGGLAVYDKEFDGTNQPFPVKFKVSDLKAAEKTVWLEGKSKTKKWRGARLDLGMDRPAGGLPKKPKHNGDWARFTVVQITKVELKYKPEKGKPIAWDKKKKRFYINLKDDDDGRKVKIGATISPKLKDVVLHFMLAPDKDNLKNANGGTDPTTWKWKKIDADVKRTDRADREHLVHLSEKTNAKGYAEKELTLSRCGAHKFTPGCYIDQDPHVGKYVHGHADLAKRKPVQAKYAIEVWRQVWYQIAKPKGGAAPKATKSETAYEEVNVLYKTHGLRLFKRSHFPANLRDRTFYPEWMIEHGGGNKKVAVIGGHNWHVFKDDHNKFFPMTKEKKRELAKLTACIVAVDHQWDPKVTGLKTTKVVSNPSGWITMSKNVVKPALAGALVRTGNWKVTKKSDSSVVANGTFDAGGILVEKGRANIKQVKVKLPSSVDQYLAADKIADYDVDVEVKLDAGKSFLGESDGADIMVVYDPGDTDDYYDTVSHETAHSLGQTFNTGEQPTGLPDHPFRNTDQGTHCSYPHTPKVRSPFEPKTGKTQADHECIMYESGPVTKAGNSFCKVCRKYLLIQEMTSL